MDYLIDSQILVWLATDTSRFTPNQASILSQKHHRLFMSIATPYELYIKEALGKLRLKNSIEHYIREYILLDSVVLLPITMDHLSAFKTLPFHHKDPFDRLIIAQAIVEKLPIITSDTMFDRYDIETIR